MNGHDILYSEYQLRVQQQIQQEQQRSSGRSLTQDDDRRIVDELHELARHCGRNTDSAMRQRLAAIEVDVRLIALNNMRTLAGVLGGSDPGPVSSIGRLMLAEFEKRLHELAVEVIGPASMLDPKDRHSIQKGRWVTGFLATRASTIGAKVSVSMSGW